MILDIPVQLTVELGRTKIPIRNLLQLAQGSVVELDRLAGEPMDVLVNGCLIAQGEVVVVNDKFGIRLTDVIAPDERLRRLQSMSRRHAGARVPLAATAFCCILLGAACGRTRGRGQRDHRQSSAPVSLLSLLQVRLRTAGGARCDRAVCLAGASIRARQGAGGGLLKVVGGVMVGPRERLVVVEVGDTWLLLGVAASSVTLVHSMPKPLQADAAHTEPGQPVSAPARDRRWPRDAPER